MNQKDKLKLLELAALSGGIQFRGYDLWYEDFSAYDPEMDCNYQWNPLDDDGAALRLAIKLRLSIDFAKWCNTVYYGVDRFVQEDWRNKDQYKATRLAIVKAAAEIGEEMKGRK